MGTLARSRCTSPLQQNPFQRGWTLFNSFSPSTPKLILYPNQLAWTSCRSGTWRFLRSIISDSSAHAINADSSAPRAHKWSVRAHPYIRCSPRAAARTCAFSKVSGWSTRCTRRSAWIVIGFPPYTSRICCSGSSASRPRPARKSACSVRRSRFRSFWSSWRTAVKSVK